MWATVAEADSFFGEEYGFSEWDSYSDSEKEQLLTTAFRRLRYDHNYVWPATASNEMQQANILLAYYTATDTESEKRASLQQQGVSKFQISKFSEEYRADTANVSQYPLRVANLISQYHSPGGSALGEITREPYER